MRELLRFEHVSFQYPQQIRPLFEDVSFVLFEGDRVGVLGTNGSGKTTLLRLIAGVLEPTGGQIVRRPHRISTLPQHDVPGNLEYSVLTFLLGDPFLQSHHHELETMEQQGIPDPIRYANGIEQFQEQGGFERIQEIYRHLRRWGLDPEWAHRCWVDLSGGEKRLLHILRTLLHPAELYLLDEPTNFLDDQGLNLLVRAIQREEGAFVIVSHDRWFLDQTVSQIFELDRGHLTVYRGNYTRYFETKQRLRLEREREAQKINREIRHLKQVQHQYHIWGHQKEKEKRGAFDKGFIGSRAARLMKRAARAREQIQKRIEELERVKPYVERVHPIAFPEVYVPRGICLSVFQVSKFLGGKVLFRGLSFTVSWGEKVVILGPNGAGKTTLLRLLLGDLPLDEGEIHWHGQARIGNLPQALPPDPDARPLIDRYPTDIRTRALELLGCLGVRQETVYRPTHLLSEGQRRKVRLVDLMLKAPNVLILDEPTTHLDTPSIELLQQALQHWNGTVLLVSHDRYLREAVADRSIVLQSPGQGSRP